MLMKLIAMIFVLTFVISCVFKPKSIVSKLDSQKYSLNYTGNSEDEVKTTLNADATGICKEEHNKKYFKRIKIEVKNTGFQIEAPANELANLAGKIGNTMLDKHQDKNWRGNMEFQCM